MPNAFRLINPQTFFIHVQNSFNLLLNIIKLKKVKKLKKLKKEHNKNKNKQKKSIF
jgi:hypothetical protein